MDTKRDREQIHTVSDRKSLIIMLGGFGLLCFVNVACFFPSVLMPSLSHTHYQAYNFSATLAGVAAALCYGFVALRGSRSALIALAGVGHVMLLVGLCMAGLAGPSSDAGYSAVAGAAIGIGLAFAMLYWFGMLIRIPREQVMGVQGLQALGGELVFIGVITVMGTLPSILVYAAVVASAACAVAFYRSVIHAGWDVPGPTSLHGAFGLIGGWRAVWDVNAAPFAGLAIVSFLYGAITAVAMGPEGSPISATISSWGAPVGAVVFLAWCLLSKTKDFSLAMKIFFFVLVLAVAVLPFDMITLGMSAGYQICSLLLFSYIIMTFGPYGYRLSAVFLTFGYVVMHVFFLTGLYLPAAFSVSSYESFISSTSLLLFLAYLLFAGILFFTSRERRRERAEKERILEQRNRERREFARSHTHDTEQLHQEICEQIGRDFGLTRRETDVMILLAKGRDLGHVSSELFLARNTVKGYVKKVYAKLGVHAKQELIDMVEKKKIEQTDQAGEHHS